MHNITDYNRNLSQALGNFKNWILLYLRVFQILMGLILGFKRKEKCRNELTISKLRHYYSGERGIRTPDTLLTYTRFPGVPLKPLEHLSIYNLPCTMYHFHLYIYSFTSKHTALLRLQIVHWNLL